MVNFCVFSLLLSYAPQEPSGNISLWSPPLPPGKLGKLTPLPPGKSDPSRGVGGGYGYFLEPHIIICLVNFLSI